MKGFLVAGTASGVGKTTVTLAISAALRRRGLVVQPFKGGPDFLDTGHHTRICGRTARNLDTWMLSVEANRAVLRNALRGADALVVEGMMGLFDGKGGTSEAGSSAEIAKLLKLPVVLVLDAGKTARSIAAVVLGFELFDTELDLAGVILNRVASARHYSMLKTAIEAACKTPVLGWLPREDTIAIPERHLGLQTAEEGASGEELEQRIDKLAALAEEHLEVARLLSLECGLDLSGYPPLRGRDAEVRIGMARDRAFSFHYEDNLDLLREEGATIVEFSPLDDVSLPADLNALYIAGGYPELYGAALSTNRAMQAAIHDFAASGRPVYAECGGMMYLARSVKNNDGGMYAMCNVMPLDIEMTRRLVDFGYVTIELTSDCVLGSAGTAIRGHSFHYSRIVNGPDIETNYRVRYSLSEREQLEGYCVGNVLASYVHIHFRAEENIARSFVAAAVACRAASMVCR